MILAAIGVGLLALSLLLSACMGASPLDDWGRCMGSGRTDCTPPGLPGPGMYGPERYGNPDGAFWQTGRP